MEEVPEKKDPVKKKLLVLEETDEKSLTPSMQSSSNSQNFSEEHNLRPKQKATDLMQRN